MRYQEELNAVKDKIAAIEAESAAADEELGSFYAEAGRTIAEAGGLEAWPDLNSVYKPLADKKAALAADKKAAEERIEALGSMKDRV